MDDFLKKFLLNSEAKSLATFGKYGINVIPVSTIFIEEDKIILVDYFMQKTLENILENKEISFAAWRDLFGFQIKADCEYVKDGELFKKIVVKVKDILPDRIVKGILILSIKNIVDIAPSKNTREHFSNL